MLRERFKEDLNRVFFNVEEFASEIMVNGSTIKAIISTKEEAIFGGELHTNVTTALIKKVDFKNLNIKAGNIIMIDDEDFYINYIEENSSDLVTLFISKNAGNVF